jgi:hypothetical protein
MEYNCGVRLPLQTEILERFQSKSLCIIVDTTLYTVILRISKHEQLK